MIIIQISNRLNLALISRRSNEVKLKSEQILNCVCQKRTLAMEKLCGRFSNILITFAMGK